MEYREDKKSNDLFFICSLIDYVARKTKNTRKDTVNGLGIENIKKIYDLADVYHCENIDKVAEEFIEKSALKAGVFDNVAACKYSVPTYWDIGKVYKRLILGVAKNRRENSDVIGILFEVYNSWITEYIDDYNSNMYYSNPDFIFQSYLEGKVLEE